MKIMRNYLVVWTQNRLIIIIFSLTWLFLNNFQTFLFLASFLLTFRSSRSLLLTSLHVFISLYRAKLPPISNFAHLPDQVFFFILSRWPNHISLLETFLRAIQLPFLPKLNIRNHILWSKVAYPSIFASLLSNRIIQLTFTGRI